MHAHVLHNDHIHPASANSLAPGQVGLVNGWGVFSTIRVMGGVLFAFEDHFARMRRDAKRMRVPFPESSASMKQRLLELVKANAAAEATLRVIVVRNRGGMWEGPGVNRDYDLIAFTAEVKRWGPGVKLGVVPDARHAASPFAGAKILSWSHNLVWLEEAQSRGLDEVILLNEHRQVSECTSANVFAAEGSVIATPPLSSGCLPGVTRKILLTEIHVAGIQIVERDLNLSDLEKADEVFITSTTRGLLPVTSIEGLAIRSGASARQPVQAAFHDYVTSYVEGEKRRTGGSG